jgi:hypothetical protein
MRPVKGIAAPPDVFTLLRRLDERPSEWGPSTIRVTCADGSVVAGELAGWDSTVLVVRSESRDPLKIAIGSIERVEAYGANKLRASVLGVALSLPLAAVTIFVARDPALLANFLVYGVFGLLALGVARLSQFVFKSAWFSRWASRWHVLYNAPRA